MMNYFLVAVGGALGSMARFWSSGFAARHIGEWFPWGTLIVNVSGSLVIGAFAALSATEGPFFIRPELRIFVMVGLCGGFDLLFFQPSDIRAVARGRVVLGWRELCALFCFVPFGCVDWIRCRGGCLSLNIHGMFAIGPKRTSLVAPYARIRGKADALITLPMPAFGRLERRLERVIDFAGRAAFHVRNGAGLEFADLILEFVR
jgi:CrcB-like protein, Camphor Resistance (CrcB)